MPLSDYIKRYIDEAELENSDLRHPAWLRDFFKCFSDSLRQSATKASSGDRYIVSVAFRDVLINHLFPKKIVIKPEEHLDEHIDISTSDPLGRLLKNKRVDFFIAGKNVDLFIEFKTNLQFNDLAAAMVEMAALKRFFSPEKTKTVQTASLHLFPSQPDIEGLRALNAVIGNPPLDHIWVLCKAQPEFRFDIDAIKSFRKQVTEIVG